MSTSRVASVHLCGHLHCSDGNDNIFVVGTLLDEIKRIGLKCDQCDEYACCDTCFGATEHGLYNTSDMSDDFQEIPELNVCKICNYDRCLGQNACSRCTWQNLKGVPRPATRLVGNRFSDEFMRRYDLRYYRLINDCVSCS